jgi:hypothetical protein
LDLDLQPRGRVVVVVMKEDNVDVVVIKEIKISTFACPISSHIALKGNEKDNEKRKGKGKRKGKRKVREWKGKISIAEAKKENSN